MSESIHPDADSLSAFLEGALPEHERQACLAHFAQCPTCREVVFLAQEPVAVVSAPKPVPFWRRRWFVPTAALSGAAACALLVAVLLPMLRKPESTPVMVASNRPPAAQRPIRAEQPPAAPKFVAPPDKAARALRRSDAPAPTPTPPVKPLPMNGRNVAPLLALRPAEMSPAPPPATSASAARGVVSLNSPRNSSPVTELSQVAGSVTDPTGAGIAGATVTLGQVSGATTEKARTDSSGKFQLEGVPAGKYELHVDAAGFQNTSSEIELKPNDHAIVSPVLAVGSASQTVEVTASAAAPVMQARSKTSSAEDLVVVGGSVSGALFSSMIPALPPNARPLPSKLPVSTSAASGKHLLATDSAGALFYSQNKGKSWKLVKPAWTGKVVRLAASAPNNLQLTTDSGAVWTSNDGQHWRQ